MKGGIADEVRRAGGEVFAISSEPQALADRAHQDWQLDFENVGDPHHEIADTCRERGWLDLFVNERTEFLEQSIAKRSADWSVTHPKGFFQPGVIVLRHDGRVLYRCRGVPTHQNMGGATERPTAEHVWAQAQEAIAAAPAEDVALDTDPPLDMRGVPWPLFSSLLIANGWFLRPQGFEGPRMIAMAGLRWIGFIAAWIAAFVMLPPLPVAVALAAWIAFIVPQYRFAGEQFQDVSDQLE